ncbi:MAG: type IV secretory system conjugative DNA transfer family protein, partial [Chloroflexota bacterium]
MPAGEANGRNGAGEAVFLVIALGALGITWGGAQLAALLSGRRLAAGLGPTFHALVRLPANAAEPRLAWGPPWQNALPTAPLYWACTGFAALLGLVALVLGLRVFGRGRVGMEKRTRLGVDTNARLATPRDLRPLIVRGPKPGRLILGRVGRHLVASELRNPAKPPRPGSRVGDRSAIAVIGPSRCGKSANIISAILE